MGSNGVRLAMAGDGGHHPHLLGVTPGTDHLPLLLFRGEQGIVTCLLATGRVFMYGKYMSSAEGMICKYLPPVRMWLHFSFPEHESCGKWKLKDKCRWQT